MSEVENISVCQSDLKMFMNEFGEKIRGYVANLKQKSSNEILNGSVQKAQRLLDKVVLVEEGVDKVTTAHEFLLAILEQSENENIDSEFISDKFRGKVKNSSDNPSDTVKEKSARFRMPLLKALIYLGGSSDEEEIVEYIKKEPAKILSKEEIDSNDGDKEPNWISEIRQQCKIMNLEKLIKFDESRNQWEISQKGIDCLAKNDK